MNALSGILLSAALSVGCDSVIDEGLCSMTCSYGDNAFDRSAALVSYAQSACADPGGAERYVEDCEYSFVDEDACDVILDIQRDVCDKPSDWQYKIYERRVLSYSALRGEWVLKHKKSREEDAYGSCFHIIRTVE